MRLLAEFDALRRRIRERNPDLGADDRAALADEWSEAVDEALRQRVQRLRAYRTSGESIVRPACR
jgi:hypothetical protein